MEGWWRVPDLGCQGTAVCTGSSCGYLAVISQPVEVGQASHWAATVSHLTASSPVVAAFLCRCGAPCEASLSWVHSLCAGTGPEEAGNCHSIVSHDSTVDNLNQS